MKIEMHLQESHTRQILSLSAPAAVHGLSLGLHLAFMAEPPASVNETRIACTSKSLCLNHEYSAQNTRPYNIQRIVGALGRESGIALIRCSANRTEAT